MPRSSVAEKPPDLLDNGPPGTDRSRSLHRPGRVVIVLVTPGRKPLTTATGHDYLLIVLWEVVPLMSERSTRRVPASETHKGPLATVAVVANQLGLDGWELTEGISQARSIDRPAFELAYVIEDEESPELALPGTALSHLGWRGEARYPARLRAARRGSSPAVSARRITAIHAG